MGSLGFVLLVAVRASPHFVSVHHMISCRNTGDVNGLSLLSLAGRSGKESSCLIGLADQHPVSKRRQVVPQVPTTATASGGVPLGIM